MLIYYKKFAHAITGAEQSHHMSSASWRPKKVSGNSVQI